MSTIVISGKTLGAKKPLFADWSIPLPPDWGGEGGRTLRDLIAQVVRTEVQAFRERQEERRTFRALTARQLTQGVERGKIEMGGREGPEQTVDEEEAVAVACQAFEDGLFLAIIDNETYRELDREVHLSEESRVAFVRLTMLAGG